ncbi:hypothetical protein M6B38_130365 [Iris pallida]|uniref:Uncharacterized protein n=1 Tax=Iris pallida TaxID=29817 RepID=A0AAX6G0B2_IRIPA|nr:hypothetical protein M6B38_130365 [Iris pallida]
MADLKTRRWRRRCRRRSGELQPGAAVNAGPNAQRDGTVCEEPHEVRGGHTELEEPALRRLAAASSNREVSALSRRRHGLRGMHSLQRGSTGSESLSS